jgi:hypothetical protein
MCGACSTHEEVGNAYTILVGNLDGRDHLGDTRIDGSIILK